MSALDLALVKHPSFNKPMRKLIEMLEEKKWGSVEMTIKNGRVTVWKYSETEEVRQA